MTTPSLIIDACSSYYDVPRDDILSSSKKRLNVRSRHMAMYLSKTMVDQYSYESLGELFNRDYSTVIVSVHKMQNEIARYEDTREEAAAIRESLNRQVKITVPMLPPGLNGDKGLMRMHWSAYAKLRDDWTWWIKSESNEHFERCEVRMDRFYASQALDLDNAYASAKIPLDALRHAGVIADDDPESVVSLTVR